MKKVILSLAIVTIILGLSTNKAEAMWPFDLFNKDQTQTNSSSTFPPVIQAIIDKFKLNPEEVKTVMNEVRQTQQTERQADMDTKLDTWLSGLVSKGKITAEQKELILNKHEEMQKQRTEELANWQNMTPEQRKAQAEQRQSELKTWAEQNGIDLQYLMPFGSKGEFRSKHMGRNMMNKFE